RPRRPRRHAEVRLRRRPRRAGAGLGARDGGPGGRGDAGQAAAAPHRRRGDLPRRRHGRRARPGRGAARARRPRGRRRLAGAVLRPRGERGDGRRGQGGRQGGRQPRRRGRGRRLRRAGGPRQPRPLGSQARRAAGLRAHEHPGDQGGRDRRGVGRRRPAGLAGARPDHLGRRGRHLPAHVLVRRRHRGRHLQRRAHRRPPRHEAAVDAEPTGAHHRRRRDQGGDCELQGAHRRHGGPGHGGRGRGDGGARAGVRGPAQVRRRLGGRVRTERGRLPGLAVVPAVAPGGRDEHRRSGDGAGDGTVAPPAGPARGRLARAARVLRDEALLALELAGLLALAVTRPVLDSFGRSPETFLARGATARDVVASGVLVAVVPALALSSVGVASRLGGRRVRGWCHSALVGLAGGLAVWRLGVDATAWGRALVAGAAVAAGAVLLVARHRSATLATYLRFLGVASVGFLVQFLALSPTGELVVGGGGGVPAGETALPAEAGALPPAVVVVLDALPTTSLLDGHGRIDADLFPNLAALADDATWYRNHTTTALHTFQAVPSMLSGRLP